MRVLFVIGTSEQYRALVSLVDAADPAAVQFLPVAMDRGDGPLAAELAERGVPLEGLAARPGWSGVPGASQRLSRLIARIEPDLIHTNLFFPCLTGEIARAGLRKPPPSVLCRHHNLQHHLQHKRGHVVVDRATGSHATRIIAVADAVRTTMVERERIDPAKVEVVRNGFDWDALAPSVAGTRRWRSRYADRSLVVAAGRLDPIKDLPTLLRAVVLVTRRHPDLVLAIAGTGPPAIRRELEALAATLQVSQHVDFVGYVDPLSELVSAADVFAQASVDEACSQTISEAVGMGVPVAVTTTGGTGEIVRDVQPSLPPGRPELLAARITALLDDRTAARRTAEAAAAAVRERFSTSHQLERYLQVYGRVLDEGGR